MRLTALFLVAAACNGPTGKDSVPRDSETTVIPDDSATVVDDDMDDDGILADADCDDNDAAVGGPTTWYGDADKDGHGNAEISVVACEAPSGFLETADDCDDLNPTVAPGATEICDGLDNDCDALTDDADDSVDSSTGTAFYPDLDGDGYGDAAAAIWACAAPTDSVEDSTDCDDSLPAIHPGSAEICDNLDNDCDGTTDQGAVDMVIWAMDMDGDGFGDATMIQTSCAQPSGYVNDLTDCNDQDANTYPGATESCTDSTDFNCDGSVGRVDNDRDGYAACEECDDRNAIVNPGATESCNGIDDDCSGAADDGAVGASLWYLDLDGDSYGDLATAMSACTQSTGYVSNSTDCNDADGAYHPGATETCTDTVDYNCDGSLGFSDNDGDGFAACLECDDNAVDVNPNAVEVCDGIDNNCDNLTDDASAADASTWYLDADLDGYGGTTMQMACSQPASYNAMNGDCDDGNRTVSPAATEVCDSIDNDCDGLTDDGDSSLNLATAKTWYGDGDGDNYGDANLMMAACLQPTGYVSDKTDCNDTASGIYPGASELCNSMDDNCNGTVDESTAIDAPTWYVDADADGYGSSTYTAVSCSQPTGYVNNSSDCDDTDADYASISSFYADMDGDSYGDPNSAQSACTPPSGYVKDNTDCDDTDASQYPSAVFYKDADGDSYGNGGSPLASCTQPSGYVTNMDDCDDANAAVNPAATEVCDGVDNDCNSFTDDADSGLSVASATTWYIDFDGDTYGSLAYTKVACAKPSGYVTDKTDCNDSSASVHPGGQEICDSANADEDCDGVTDDSDSSATGQSTWYADTDADNYGASSVTKSACDQPSGYVSNKTDCNDNKTAINPGAQEVCDASNTDEDCDGLADDADSSVSSTGKITVYRDGDNDTYGDPASTTLVCDSASGYVSDKTDCDDGNKNVHPNAQEICDGSNTDEDCDSLADDNDSSVAASGKSTWYLDNDSDSYGNSTKTKSACDKPTGYVSDKTDCNDGNSAINPAAQEVCDISNVDEDCDNLTDDLDSTVTGKYTWYQDQDADTYGNASVSLSLCDQPTAYVSDKTDCNDTNATINPAGQEVCDASNADEDCDGLTDDNDSTVSSASFNTWYYDADADSYGGSSVTKLQCDQPTNYVASKTDCDDTNLLVNPGATEVCKDGLDNNCDGSAGSCLRTGIVSTSTATATWKGEATSDYLGVANDFVGDMNGDGYDDILLGAYGNDAGGTTAGAAYMVYGSASPTGGTISASYGRYAGGVASDNAGYSVAAAGDVNNDGYDDALIGAYGYTSYNGGAFLIYGSSTKLSSSSTLNSTNYPVFTGVNSYGYLGYNLSGVGDIDKDGYDDFVIGGWNVASGPVYLVFGQATKFSGNTLASSLVTLTGETTGYIGKGNNIGHSDLNADGYEDIALGASELTVTSSYTGGVYLIMGSSTRPVTNSITTEMDQKITGVAASYFGRVTGAGDYNGDGYDDLMASGYAYDSPATDAGGVWIIAGKATGWTGTVAITSSYLALYTGEAASDYLGYSLAQLGDVNKDGFDDIQMGAFGNDAVASAAGADYIFYGSSSRSGTVSASTANLTIRGGAASDQVGGHYNNHNMPGDVDADGYYDILAGSIGSGGTFAGAGYLFLGTGQ